MEPKFYLQRCLQLAKLGLGKAAPNPMVGSVLVYNNKIIGEGFHKQFGEAHAEVNCINSVKPQDKKYIKDSTIYVSLEPCSHFGKTPPCANLIIKNEIKKVVICTKDSSPKVKGGGIEKLKNAGVEIEIGNLDLENKWLNRRFFTFHDKKRPYIILKYAQTKNGYFCPESENQKWISNDFSKKITHKWRSEEQAILVGTKTALIDNPQLNVRLWKENNSLLRVCIDRNLQIPESYNLRSGNYKTLIFNKLKNEIVNNVEYAKLNFKQNVISKILNKLYENQIQSLIVEGGLFTLQEFINANLWDEARIITGNVEWKNGKASPKLTDFEVLKKQNLMNNELLILKNNKAK